MSMPAGMAGLKGAYHGVFGVPDYDAYLAHQRKAHPGLPAMDYAAFIRARQDARYGRGNARCC